MTPKDRQALEQMLQTIRDGAQAGLDLLGPSPDLCPKCGSARWQKVVDHQGGEIRYCEACGHEWIQALDTELVRLQEGEADAGISGA